MSKNKIENEFQCYCDFKVSNDNKWLQMTKFDKNDKKWQN